MLDWLKKFLPGSKNPGRSDHRIHNALCPCGSGKMRAQCCMINAAAVPSDTDQQIALALQYHQDGQLQKAASLYQELLNISPNHPQLLAGLGKIALQVGNFEEGVKLLGLSLEADANQPVVFYNCGIGLAHFNRFDEALASYDRAIALKPDFAEAHNNRGLVLEDLMRLDEALASYDRAIALKSDYAGACNNRGNVLFDMNRFEDALESYDRALALNPDAEFIYGMRLHTKMRICDWADVENQHMQLEKKIECGEKAATPFSVLAITSSLALQKKSAEIYVNDAYPMRHSLPEIYKYPKHDRIRIGYFSADFHNHATSYLMAEMFEMHDKTKFELIAFSFGPAVNDDMRKRVAAAFDQFIDVRSQSDKDIAALSRNLEIDIAVDLKGFTQESRVGIFAERAAPIQVNYLGYPGTMGAEYIDYLIADPILIPENSQKYYSEKIAYLPNSYQVNDTKRLISEKQFTREESELPQIGFVFCCFNSSYKITPATFDGWMRILNRVNGSVLWLLEDSARTVLNLRKEAVRRGVDGERLIFAKRMPLSDHLARHRLADLFLDTFPCNAHTTASDALWAGMPVLTLAGEAFSSRVAASLLNAIHLPELVTFTQTEYETLAIALATNPKRLMEIRERLARNRLVTPLFDTRLFTRHIEVAYAGMYERYQSDLPPGYLYVQNQVNPE